jgi:uncharacterized protein (DUF305 family)
MSSNRTIACRAALAATAATAALTLAACGGNGTSASSTGTGHHALPTSASASASASAHNAADVTFAKEMIQHHRQAVAMSELAAGRASSAEVKSLATKIKNAQDPEITTMSGWLRSWGEQVPTDMNSDMSGGMNSMQGMDHSGGSSTPGMMSDQDMAALKAKSGKAFDAAFLTMMTGHHEGAVEMAKTEKKQGAYAPAKTLSDSIITAQTAEISQMHKLLGAS